MTAWNYPGPEHRGENWVPLSKQTRWCKPEWKSLAWVVQLLMALDLFFVIMLPLSRFGGVLWWIALVMTTILFVLVSVLAVRR